ncbi:MAG: hypothetical protein C0601_02535 [Candidatus Muiribacterium halophilum]|uniref:Flagellin n=1 Tax=Muiribacterium halophilum TaxID=2053465 RepID=A0A2N5ZKP1_MUIH1|nr:MAG: hypothetical protein C0601_02535 [Candidatus Muirbacterium halophilum]
MDVYAVKENREVISMIGRINNNSYSINFLNNSKKTENSITKLMERLSSGKRINSFADDAAGGAISEKLRAQFSQYDQEISNYEDNINRFKTEEGAYQGINDNLQAIRKLQVQARNDTLNDDDKAAIQNEIDMLVESTSFIVDSAEFNTKKIVEPGEELQKILDEGIQADGDFVDDALKEVNSTRSELGAEINSTEKNIDRQMIAYENTVAAYSTISDMDMAKGITEMTSQQILQQANASSMKAMFNINKASINTLLGN